VDGRNVERHRYAFLLLSILTSIAVQGIVPPGDLQKVVVTALAAASVALAVRAARIPPRLVTISNALALLVLSISIVHALGAGVGEGATLAMNAALVALGPPAIAVGVIRDLREHQQVRVPSVMGVLAFYMLMGLLFAFTYGALDRLGDAPFFAGGQEATASHCIYFSFTTLTTVGYGDFVARSDLGHTLAVFEMLIGQIYLVTIVSLFVSNLRPRRPPI
jgi:Ion channel